MGNCQQFNPKDQVKGAHKTTIAKVVRMIKYYTWNRDSHGLFDYESKNVVKGQFRTGCPQVVLIRSKEEIKVFQGLEEMKQWKDGADQVELMQLVNKMGRYIIESGVFQVGKPSEDTEGVQEGCIWTVVKSVTNKENVMGYEMKEGDFIKLGRVRFRIREVKVNLTQGKYELRQLISDKNLSYKHIDKGKSITEEDNHDQGDDDARSRASQSELQCRICLGPSEPDNPLIDICQCQGSVKFIHILCLQKWLGNKLAPKITKFSVSFIWKKFECEICKSPFPNVIDINGVSWDTVEIPKPAIPYITIEILSRDKNQSKGTHIISLANKPQIKLGRGHDQDVRLTDISVSRFHAIIKFVNGVFYLEDNRSKFGTLVLMRGLTNIGAEENNNLAVQIGRTVISFQVKREWKAGSCCFTGPLAPENPDADEVQQVRQGDRDNIMMVRGQQTRLIHQHEEEHPQDESEGEIDNEDLIGPEHDSPERLPSIPIGPLQVENFQQIEEDPASQQIN